MAPAGIRAHFYIAILNVAVRPCANTSGVGDLLLGRELLALLPDCFYLRAVDNKSFHTRSPRFAIPRSLCTPPLASRRRHRIGTRQRSEEHTSELQSLMRISYAVFCLQKKKKAEQTKQQYEE